MTLSDISQPPVWLGHGWLAARHVLWLLRGALLTAWLSLLVCCTATAAGLFVSIVLDGAGRGMRRSVQALLALHRNTPLLVQLLLWYFGIGGLLPESLKLWLNATHRLELGGYTWLAWPSFEFLAAFVALSLYSTAFIVEELRAGLNTIGRGQREAALALGLDAWQVMRRVVLPQALIAARRPLIGQYTAVIKNTSLTMAIGVAELSYTSRQVESESLLAFQAFAVATLLYLLLVFGAQLAGREAQTSWRVPQ